MTYQTEFRVYVDFDNDGSFDTAGDDITAYVKAVDVERGLQNELQRVAHVGTCRITLNNETRLFSPLYTVGTYYGKLLPNRPVRVDVVTGASTSTVFRGYTKAWRVDSNKYGRVEATLECEDVLGVLQDFDLSLPLQQNQTADELLRLVGSAAFRTARASGYIEFEDNAGNNETVTIGDVTYQFKTALTVPAVANEVLIGADAEATATNLVAAINGEEGAGTLYSTGTERADVATARLDGEVLSIPTAGVAQGFAVGRFDNGYLYYEGQSFTLNTGGLFTEFAVWFGNRGGSPAGTVTWSLYEFDAATGETVGAALESGTFTPTTPEPAWNTITAAGTTYLEPGTYKLELKPTVDQTTGNYWVVLASDGAAGDVYADGMFWQLQADPASSWGAWTGQDLTMTLTCSTQRVYLDANARGAWGNSIALAESGANLAVSGATLSGGVDGPVGLMSYETGTQTIEIAGDDWTPENTNALNAMSDVVNSEWGFLWAAGDGTLTFKNRDWIFKQQATAAVLALDNEPDAIQGGVNIGEVYNQVVLTYQPRAILDVGVVARLNTGIQVDGKRQYRRRNPSDPVRAVSTVVKIPYIDPDTGQTIGAKDLVHPVPGTDYRVTRGKLGLTVDKSSEGFITCTLARNATDVEVTFQNTNQLTHWVWDFQVRGAGMVKYDRENIIAEDADSIAAYGRRTLPRISIPYPSTRAFAESVAAYMLSRHKDALFRIPTIAFKGQTKVGSVALYSVDVGDVVTVTEHQAALDAARFMVIGMRWRLEMGGKSALQWFVRRLDDVIYGIYDDATYGLYNSARYTI